MKCLFKATDETDEKKIFKLLLLIDLTELEKYIAQTRLQARRSFMLSAWVAICGSILLLTAIVLGIVLQVFHPGNSLNVAYLSAIAGIITQLISGIFFYFYNMTLRQINLFHSRLESSRKVCISLYLQSLITDSTTERNKAKLELIKFLVLAELSDQLDQTSEGKQNEKPHEVGTAPPTAA